MVLIITKDMTAEEIKAALNKLNNNDVRGVRRFYGKLKGVFEDGLAYQKAIRNG